METRKTDPRLYMRIAAEIRDQITSGTLAPGAGSTLDHRADRRPPYRGQTEAKPCNCWKTRA